MKAQSNSDYGRGGELNTIIGKGSTITGDLKVANSLRVDGTVKGNIKSSDTFVLGKNGVVEGEVIATNIMLAGTVIGNVSATGKVFLESTSSVSGDIKASRLVVDEGASFDGKCAMKKNSTNK
ncbi:polymer-forming cytoskeletal protein [bacterium]|nr:polymer-forming cytoskeletal protein [bacterium]